MKKLLFMISSVAVLAGLSSCNKDNTYTDPMLANAVVTVKSDADGTFLQLDDSTTIRSKNLKKDLYKKEVRALCSISAGAVINPGKENQVSINWLDTIRTKKAVSSLESIENDPLEIINTWTTVVEDGYFTMQFRTYWATHTHILELVCGQNPENPYELVLSHDNGGDVDGRIGDGIIAFDLSVLPSTGGRTVPLTIKWKSFSGDKTAQFKYKSRN